MGIVISVVDIGIGVMDFVGFCVCCCCYVGVVGGVVGFGVCCFCVVGCLVFGVFFVCCVVCVFVVVVCL